MSARRLVRRHFPGLFSTVLYLRPPFHCFRDGAAIALFSLKYRRKANTSETRTNAASPVSGRLCSEELRAAIRSLR